MEIQEKKVTLRKLTASEGKVIISKETQTDENGNEVPLVRAKEVYLGKADSEENYLEVEEENNG